jgi:outer membrane biosynthesis protein TonB
MMSKILHALAISSILAVVILNVPAGPVWAEEQLTTSTQVEADSRIISLLNKIETALVKSPDVQVDEVSRMLVAAQSLLPSASAQVRSQMQDFPARLKKHADEDHDDGVRGITLTAFADVISHFFGDPSEATRPEPAPVQPPIALTPAPAKQEASETTRPEPAPVQPSVALTPAPAKQEASETTRPEPAPVQPSVALTPAPAKQEASETTRPEPAPVQPSVALTPAPAKQEAKSPVASSTERTLLERGDAMLRLGDVSAARMLFVRAAELGIGIAALKVADTYDPAFLAEHNLRGIKADPVEAETWYRKAQAMGEPQAEEHLKSLERRRLLATH